MTSASSVLRGLVIYGVILPLAIILGYLLATPLDRTTMAMVGLVLLVLVTPVLLRWHHPLLFLSWNMTAVVFFLPGRPQVWLIMAFVSLTISLVQRTLVRNIRFIKTRTVLYPLLFICIVTLVTALLTGGVGLRAFGSENIGGRRYIYMFAGVAGYIAMTAHRIPRERALLYVSLFILGALTNAVGTLLPYVPSSLQFLFLTFPVEKTGLRELTSGVMEVQAISRYHGLTQALMAGAFFMLARYGLKELLLLRKWRSWIFFALVALNTIGGFRSILILVGMVMFFSFWLEGLHRSTKLPIVVGLFLLTGVALISFSTKLPLSIQRTLSILPIQVDPVAAADAKNSTEWRLQIWRSVLPEVPKHLWLGKGLAMKAEDFESTISTVRGFSADTASEATLAQDYHSGPLSIIIPFGVWGVLGWLWFLAAAFRALYWNYRNGDPAVQTINTFLLAYFAAKVILFFVVFGTFYKDLAVFAGIVGLSISLNNGIRKPKRSPATRRLVRPRTLWRPSLVPHVPRT